MTGPLGNSEYCFPQISVFPPTSFRDQSLRAAACKYENLTTGRKNWDFLLLRQEDPLYKSNSKLEVANCFVDCDCNARQILTC